MIVLDLLFNDDIELSDSDVSEEDGGVSYLIDIPLDASYLIDSPPDASCLIDSPPDALPHRQPPRC